MSDESMILACPHCNAGNRVPRARLDESPNCGRCHAPLFGGHPAALDEAALDAQLRGDLPLLVDVWAPWCGPCRTMAPQFDRAASLLEPDFRLLKMNADEAPNVSAQLGVRGIPAMFLLNRGAVVAQTAGAMNA